MFSFNSDDREMVKNPFLFTFITDASSSNEAVHLQQRLRSLSTELVTLRNRLHVSQPPNGGSVPSPGTQGALSKSPEKGNSVVTGVAAGVGTNTGSGGTGNGNGTGNGAPSSPAPAVPPRTSLPPASTVSHGICHPTGHSSNHSTSHTLTASAIVHPHVNHASANTLGHNSTATNNFISG